MKRLSQLLIFIIMVMSVTPVGAADDCYCDSFFQIHQSGSDKHDGCDKCSCSPFSACAACSGFVVTKTSHFDTPPISDWLLEEYVSLYFSYPKKFISLLSHKDLYIFNPGDIPPDCHKLRGSPIFS